MRTGAPRDAVGPLSRAAQFSPDDPAPAKLLHDVALRGDDGQAAVRWEREYLARERFLVARRNIIEALDVHPGDARLHARFAALMADHGNAVECVRQYASAMHLPPDSPSVLQTAAARLLAGQHPEAAIGPARLAVQAAPGDAHVQALIARATARSPLAGDGAPRGDTGAATPQFAAQAAYERACRVEETAVGPKHITPEVESLAQRAVELAPTNATFLSYLLHVQYTRRYNAAATATAQRLMALDPANAYGSVVYGLLLLDSASTPAGLDEAEKRLRAPRQPGAALEAKQHFGLGLLAMQRHHASEAVTELKEALRLDPEADSAYYKLSVAESAAGNAKDAARYMASDRRRQGFKNREAELLGDIGMHPESQRAYQRAIDFLNDHGLHAQADAVRAAQWSRQAPQSARP